MGGKQNSCEAIKKNRRQNGLTGGVYLFASVFSLVVACLFSIPLTPVFIKLTSKYPALEDAQVLTGTIQIVGEWSSKSPPTYFVMDKETRHRVYCGLPTARMSCFQSDVHAQGATGTVWFDPKFGILQWDITFHTKRAEGYRDRGSYNFGKDRFENHFRFSDYQFKFLTVFVVLVVAIYQFVKYRSLRTRELHQESGEIV